MQTDQGRELVVGSASLWGVGVGARADYLGGKEAEQTKERGHCLSSLLLLPFQYMP